MNALLKILPIKKIIPALMANLAAAAASFLLMAASAWLIATAAFHPPLSALAIGITIVRAAGIFRAVFRYIDRLLTHKVIFAILTTIRVRLYEYAVKTFPLKSGATKEGELLHDLTSGSDILKDFFPRVFQPLLCSLILTVVITSFLISTIGTAALILIASFTLTLIISYNQNVIAESDSAAYREVLLDLHDGREEIFIAGSTGAAIDRLNFQAEQLQLQHQNQFDSEVNFNSACNIVNSAAAIAILYNLADKVSGIDLAVWLLILLSMLENFSTLPAAVKSLMQIKRQSQKLIDISKNLPAPISNYSQTCAVKIKNLHFGYSDKNAVIVDFNLTIQSGERIAIVGESGAGKTTLLYLMLGLWQPDSGEIVINGSISAATYNNYIFSASIYENFSILNANISDEMIAKCLKICELENVNLHEDIGENGAKLSGGERNRLQTALALAANPQILILDEPTAGLNKILAQKLIDNIINDAKQNNRTLIIITHDYWIAQKLDRIAELTP